METASFAFAAADAAPFDFRIPAPPRAAQRTTVREPAWREAMRWSVIALSASLAAGEVVLWLGGA